MAVAAGDLGNVAEKGGAFPHPLSPALFSQEEEEEQIGLQLKDWAGRL